MRCIPGEKYVKESKRKGIATLPGHRALNLDFTGFSPVPKKPEELISILTMDISESRYFDPRDRLGFGSWCKREAERYNLATCMA